MLKYFGFIPYLWTIGLSLDFPFWDYCVETATDCELPLGSQRFAVGSAYETGSSEWYLLGGQITDSFFYTATVAVVNIPSTSGSLTGYECSNLYGSNLPQGITQSAGSVINGELYSFGGFTEFNATYYYLDTIFNSDTSTQSSFSSSLAEMPYPSSAACVVTVDTKVYIAGGLEDGSITDRVIMYDSAVNTWSELSSMNTARFAPGCTYNNGKIYVFGGQTVGGQWGFGDDLNSTEIYDIASNTWTDSDAQLSNNSHWITATYLNVANRNLAVVMGGSIGYPVIVRDNLDVYDMDLDEIVFRGNMKSARYAFEAITLSHDDWASRWLLMAGGKDGEGNVIGDVGAIYCGDIPTSSPSQSPTIPEVDPGTSNDGFMLYSIFALAVVSFAMSFE